MDIEQIVFALDNIRKEVGLCRTEKEALEECIKMLDENQYLKALNDVEHILNNQICSIRNGRLMIFDDGSWHNAIMILRNEEEERQKG